MMEYKDSSVGRGRRKDMCEGSHWAGWGGGHLRAGWL